MPVTAPGYRSHGATTWCPDRATDRRRIAVIDAYLQVLATDPTRAAIILVAATMGAAFVISGALAALAAIERRLAVIFRRRPRPLPLHGPVRPFMREVLESRDADALRTPGARPRPFRLLLAIAVVVAIVVSTGYRIVDLVPLPAPAATPAPVVIVPTPAVRAPTPQAPAR